jgi:hypothetical protein
MKLEIKRKEANNLENESTLPNTRYIFESDEGVAQ